MSGYLVEKKVRSGTDHRGRPTYSTVTVPAPSYQKAQSKREQAADERHRQQTTDGVRAYNAALQQDAANFRAHQAHARAQMAVENSHLPPSQRDRIMPRDMHPDPAQRKPMSVRHAAELSMRMVKNGFTNSR